MCSCLAGIFHFEGPPSFEKSLKVILEDGNLEDPIQDDFQMILQALEGEDMSLRPEKAMEIIIEFIENFAEQQNWVFVLKGLYIFDTCVEENIQLKFLQNLKFKNYQKYRYDEEFKDVDVEEILGSYLKSIKFKAELFNQPDPLVKLNQKKRKMRMETMMSLNILIQETKKIYLVEKQILHFSSLIKQQLIKHKLFKNIATRNLYDLLGLFRTHVQAVSVLLEKKDKNQDLESEPKYTQICYDIYIALIEISVRIQDFVNFFKKNKVTAFNNLDSKMLVLKQQENILQNLEDQMQYYGEQQQTPVVEITNARVNIEQHSISGVQVIQERDSEMSQSVKRSKAPFSVCTPILTTQGGELNDERSKYFVQYDFKDNSQKFDPQVFQEFKNQYSTDNKDFKRQFKGSKSLILESKENNQENEGKKSDNLIDKLNQQIGLEVIQEHQKSEMDKKTTSDNHSQINQAKNLQESFPEIQNLHTNNNALNKKKKKRSFQLNKSTDFANQFEIELNQTPKVRGQSFEENINQNQVQQEIENRKILEEMVQNKNQSKIQFQNQEQSQDKEKEKQKNDNEIQIIKSPIQSYSSSTPEIIISNAELQNKLNSNNNSNKNSNNSNNNSSSKNGGSQQKIKNESEENTLNYINNFNNNINLTGNLNNNSNNVRLLQQTIFPNQQNLSSNENKIIHLSDTYSSSNKSDINSWQILKKNDEHINNKQQLNQSSIKEENIQSNSENNNKSLNTIEEAKQEQEQNKVSFSQKEKSKSEEKIQEQEQIQVKRRTKKQSSEIINKSSQISDTEQNLRVQNSDNNLQNSLKKSKQQSEENQDSCQNLNEPIYQQQQIEQKQSQDEQSLENKDSEQKKLEDQFEEQEQNKEILQQSPNIQEKISDNQNFSRQESVQNENQDLDQNERQNQSENQNQNQNQKKRKNKKNKRKNK